MDTFWKLLIFIMFFGGLGALYWLIVALSKRSSSPTGQTDTTGHIWDEDLQELDNPLPAWWKTMFVLTIIFAVIYAALFPSIGDNRMFLGWSSKGRYEAEMQAAEDKWGPLFEQHLQTPIAELAKDPDALRMGERLFASYCTQCHGSDGGGARGFPNLRDTVWQWGGTPEAIETSILQGRIAAMPAWGEALGEEKVSAVASYVRSLSGQSVDATKAKAGEAVYTTTCAACHGADGKGNPMLGAPNLTDGVWLYGGSDMDVTHSIVAGRAGRMPAHENFLGKAKVHLLAAYVYSLQSAGKSD
ncbi:MAG: cytochrome-c oxidase, cbb3-type subunit III [Gammaproteobacteria bacterium]|nr:cytochrome-c oxidase, cbb3-type subunit III [Gammaproteobacteria bacterium]